MVEFSPLDVIRPLEEVEEDDSEKESLMHSFTSRQKPLNKYGTVSNSSSVYSLTSTARKLNRDKLLTHIVQPTDTLQGLALKYETSIEQIKRVNKLWSSDNLTLRSRPTLYIPMAGPIVATGMGIPHDESTTTISDFDTTSADHAIHTTPFGGGGGNNTTSRSSQLIGREDSLDSIDISFDDDSGMGQSNSAKKSTNGRPTGRSPNPSGMNGCVAGPSSASNNGGHHSHHTHNQNGHHGSTNNSRESNDPRNNQILTNGHSLANSGGPGIGSLGSGGTADGGSIPRRGEESLTDFLMRIDSRIANTRDKVITMQREDRLRGAFPESPADGGGDTQSVRSAGDTFRFSNHDHSLYTPYQAGRLSRNNSHHSSTVSGTSSVGFVTGGPGRGSLGHRPPGSGSGNNVSASSASGSCSDLIAGDTTASGQAFATATVAGSSSSASSSKGRKVRTSMRRLEKRQDELFEL